MSFRTLVFFAALALMSQAALWSADSDAPRQITVSAGEVDRVESVVKFEAQGLALGMYELSGDGVKTVLQVDEHGWGTMIEPGLAKGAERVYEIAPASMQAANEVVRVKEDENRSTAEILSGGRPVLTYQMQASAVPEGTPPIFSHGAHLHPVYSPSGRVVTGNYPSDHPHHRGIWFAWTKTEFEGRAPDFWNMGKDKSGKLTGEVRFDELEEKWAGAVSGGVVGRHLNLDHTSGGLKEVLRETMGVTVYAAATAPLPMNRFDVTWIQKTGNAPLKLPKYHYGGLGVRGSAAWDAMDAVTMLTSNGDDRVTGDSTTAKWVYIGGRVEGVKTGMLILISPDNFRFPQPLRLNPKNPQLSVAPSQLGDWEIDAQSLYVSDYRFVVLDGEPDAGLFERLWLDYASPVQVRLGR